MNTPNLDPTRDLLERLNAYLDGRPEWIETVGECNDGLWITVCSVGEQSEGGICIEACRPCDIGLLGDDTELVRIVILDDPFDDLADEAIDLSAATEVVVNRNLHAVLTILLHYRYM